MNKQEAIQLLTEALENWINGKYAEFVEVNEVPDEEWDDIVLTVLTNTKDNFLHPADEERDWLDEDPDQGEHDSWVNDFLNAKTKTVEEIYWIAKAHADELTPHQFTKVMYNSIEVKELEVTKGKSYLLHLKDGTRVTVLPHVRLEYVTK